MPRNFTVFFLSREETRSAIYGSQLVNDVKGKPRNFDGYLCRSFYSTFTTSF